MLTLLVGWLERLKGPLDIADQWPIGVWLSETQEWYYTMFLLLLLSLLTIWLRAHRS
jgi:hypothetical protein